MTKEICNQSRINSPCPVGSKKPKSSIEFEEIVKFLNAQRAVIEYAGLN